MNLSLFTGVADTFKSSAQETVQIVILRKFLWKIMVIVVDKKGKMYYCTT